MNHHGKVTAYIEDTVCLSADNTALSSAGVQDTLITLTDSSTARHQERQPAERVRR